MTTYMHDLKNAALVGTSHAPGSTITGSSEDIGSYVDCQTGVGQVFGLAAVGTVDETAVSAQAHSVKLKEADDTGGTGAQDIDGTETVTMTADSTVKIVSAHNRSKRYVAVSVTPAFTGGSTPSTEFYSAVLIQKDRF